ncbi:MAG: cell division protein FtsB [Candidatus Competibacteraceae bacterium]|nr:cell division protein FtsB [Candidatus Competibacteraceae bacterium]
MITLPLILISLSVALNVQLWLSDTQGLPKVRLLQAALQEQQNENAQLEERNQALAAEVSNLKEGVAAIEELARTELGMIRKDETFFRVLESPPPALSVTRE